MQAAAESRLRAARLYAVTGDSLEDVIENVMKVGGACLYVYVRVVGAAFHVSVEYNKVVKDRFGRANRAVTWVTRSTGTHGRDAGFILSDLSRHLDKFLADYLRVNEAACEAR